jgi:protein-S-isoprenylcysteine O-methyltransferase Ste14
VAPIALSEPAARIAFHGLLGVWFLAELVVRLRSHFNRRGERMDRGSLLVVVALMAVGVGGAFALAEHVHQAGIADGRWPLFVAGLVLMSAGIAIRQWAVAVLGRFFTVDIRVQPGQTVVERGPYRWVRHPAYAGLILTFVGIGFALENWAALAVAAVVPTAGLVVRIRLEERALLAGLGEPYRRFAAARPHLFPGLW